jgi:pimeloyl-ACP methyl ester carboxylesterase
MNCFFPNMPNALLAQRFYEQACQLDISVGQIAYLDEGKGLPLLFLHGIPLAMLTWRFNRKPLASAHRFIAVDMKGYGMSAKPMDGYTLQDHADVIAELIEALDLTGVTLVGNSYGGAVAITLALSHPESIDRLVLINTGGFPSSSHEKEINMRIRIIRIFARLLFDSGTIGRMLFASRLRQAYAQKQLITSDLIDSYYALFRRGSGERALIETLRCFDEAALAQRIPDISQRTLIIWGAKDHIHPVSNASLFLDAIKNARLEILEGCGHLPHEELPHRVNCLIQDFVAQ